MRPKQPRQRSPVLERRPLFSLTRHLPSPTLFPYTTLFRSLIRAATGHPFVVRVTAVAGDPVVGASRRRRRPNLGRAHACTPDTHRASIPHPATFTNLVREQLPAHRP